MFVWKLSKSEQDQRTPKGKQQSWSFKIHSLEWEGIVDIMLHTLAIWPGISTGTESDNDGQESMFTLSGETGFNR